MLNPPKTTYVWNLDGTLFNEFPSQKEAAGAIGISDGPMSFALRRNRVLKWKYVVSRDAAFPGVPEYFQNYSKHVWVWGLDGKFICEYMSSGKAAKAIKTSTQNVDRSIRDFYVVNGEYIITDSPEPPVLSKYFKEKVVVEKLPKYKLEERKWVSLGEYEGMEEASKESGLSARGIRLMIKGGNVYRKVFRARMRGRKIFIEKREWVESGKFKTITEIADKIKVSPQAAWRTSKIGGIILDRYKILRNPQPNQTATV